MLICPWLPVRTHSLDRVRAKHANDYRKLDFLPLLNVDFEGVLAGIQKNARELNLFKFRVNNSE